MERAQSRLWIHRIFDAGNRRWTPVAAGLSNFFELAAEKKASSGQKEGRERNAQKEREREGKIERDKEGETLLTPVWYESCGARGGSWPVDIFGIKGVSQRCIIPREGPLAKRSIGYREQLLFLSNCNCGGHVGGGIMGFQPPPLSPASLSAIFLERAADGIKPSARLDLTRSLKTFFFFFFFSLLFDLSVIFRWKEEGYPARGIFIIVSFFGSRVFFFDEWGLCRSEFCGKTIYFVYYLVRYKYMMNEYIMYLGYIYVIKNMKKIRLRNLYIRNKSFEALNWNNSNE